MKRMIDISCGNSFLGMSYLSWLLFPFDGVFRKRQKEYKNISYKLFVIISFALPQSSYFNFLRSIQIILFLSNFYSNAFFNWYEKVTCKNCGTESTKLNLARQKKRGSVGTLYCTQCPNFSTKSQNDLHYHIAKKHGVPNPDITFKCKLWYAEIPGFHALPQHKNTQHGTQIGFGASDFDVEDIVGDVDDHGLREESESCKQFLADTEMENGRHRVFNFGMSSFEISLLNYRLDYVLKELNCAAEVNPAFGFVLKNIEDGRCRYFYAH